MIPEIIHPNPTVVEGNTYDRLSVSLAMSTDGSSGTMALRLAVTVTPYRNAPNHDENGQPIGGTRVELLPDAQQSLFYPDALQAAENNERLAQFLTLLAQAGQQFINGAF
jgi:hypothetical protein